MSKEIGVWVSRVCTPVPKRFRELVKINHQLEVSPFLPRGNKKESVRIQVSSVLSPVITSKYFTNVETPDKKCKTCEASEVIC